MGSVFSGIFGGGSKPKTPPILPNPRTPTTDEAQANIDAEDRARRRRGRLADTTQASILDTANNKQYQTGGKSVLG